MRVTRGAAALAVLALAACASGTVITQGGGPSLQATQSLAPGSRHRIAVGAIIDKSQGSEVGELLSQLAVLNTDRNEVEQLEPSAITEGVRDMLVTALFNADRFIVLERQDLDAVLTEQVFSHGARVGDATQIPEGRLEGADLLVVGALTGFDPGAGGAALPLPVPLGDRGDFGILHLRMARGHVAMDLRVVDVATARVLSSVAVEGRHTRFGFNFDVRLRSDHTRVNLPGALRWFQNTPVEKALEEMVEAATAHVAARVD